MSSVLQNSKLPLKQTPVTFFCGVQKLAAVRKSVIHYDSQFHLYLNLDDHDMLWELSLTKLVFFLKSNSACLVRYFPPNSISDMFRASGV
jgi:hypothetical protein